MHTDGGSHSRGSDYKDTLQVSLEFDMDVLINKIGTIHYLYYYLFHLFLRTHRKYRMQPIHEIFYICYLKKHHL